MERVAQSSSSALDNFRRFLVVVVVVVVVVVACEAARTCASRASFFVFVLSLLKYERMAETVTVRAICQRLTPCGSGGRRISSWARSGFTLVVPMPLLNCW